MTITRLSLQPKNLTLQPVFDTFQIFSVFHMYGPYVISRLIDRQSTALFVLLLDRWSAKVLCQHANATECPGHVPSRPVGKRYRTSVSLGSHYKNVLRQPSKLTRKRIARQKCDAWWPFKEAVVTWVTMNWRSTQYHQIIVYLINHLDLLELEAGKTISQACFDAHFSSPSLATCEKLLCDVKRTNL